MEHVTKNHQRMLVVFCLQTTGGASALRRSSEDVFHESSLHHDLLEFGEEHLDVLTKFLPPTVLILRFEKDL